MCDYDDYKCMNSVSVPETTSQPYIDMVHAHGWWKMSSNSTVALSIGNQYH